MSVASETRPHGDKIDPNFQYGQTQTYVALAVLVICFLATCASMVLTQRYRHLRIGTSQQAPRRRSREEAERHLLDVTESDSSDTVASRATPNYRAVEEHTGQEERHSPIPIEDLLQIGNDDNEEETVCCEDEGERGRLRDSRRQQLQQQGRAGLGGGGDGQTNAGGAVRRRYRCNTEHQDYCSSLLRSYAVPPAREADHEHVSVLAGEREQAGEADDGLQITPHVILLLFLVTSMFVGE
jgi:hypothetical protein